ncbi:MAG: hypothetical protein ACKO23_14890, partial [Gemmataceae bacterium]
MSLATSRNQARSLQDPQLKENLQELRQTDNRTNWFYLVRSYLVLLAVIGGAVCFDLHRQAEGWCWGYSAALFALAIVIVGATQHQ